MPRLKIINLNAHPGLRATITKALARQKNRNTPKILTHKDRLIASVLRRQSDSKHIGFMDDGFVIAAYAIADALKRDNPRFDRNQFILTFRGKAK
jgi:hypothetical protein